jgi:hypothetical protein
MAGAGSHRKDAHGGRIRGGCPGGYRYRRKRGVFCGSAAAVLRERAPGQGGDSAGFSAIWAAVLPAAPDEIADRVDDQFGLVELQVVAASVRVDVLAAG